MKIITFVVLLLGFISCQQKKIDKCRVRVISIDYYCDKIIQDCNGVHIKYPIIEGAYGVDAEKINTILSTKYSNLFKQLSGYEINQVDTLINKVKSTDCIECYNLYCTVMKNKEGELIIACETYYFPNPTAKVSERNYGDNIIINLNE